MDVTTLAPVLRMVERSLIVAGGILSIYLGYKLFVLGVDKSQGQASAFGVELKNFGPGLFFAALGAVVLITTMRAAIKVGNDGSERIGNLEQRSPGAAGSASVFFGLEDSKRVANRWADTAFYADTRTLLRRIDAGESVSKLQDLRGSLKSKLDSITMTNDEYKRYQALTAKVPLNQAEQSELLSLERKLVP